MSKIVRIFAPKTYLLEQGVLKGIWNLTTTATSYYSTNQRHPHALLLQEAACVGMQ